MNTTTTIPDGEDSPSSPRPSIISSLRRYLSSISPHKTLRNLRLLILALAFGTLILDAITLSFEINVMNLDLAQRQVATQAALLFTPDLLAMTMVLVLMLRDCFGCCRTRRPHRHHDQEYEGSVAHQDEDEKIEGAQQQLRQQQEHTEIGLQGQEQGGVDQQRGKSRSRSRTSRRGTARELHQDGSRSRSGSIDGYRIGRRVEQQHYDGDIIVNNNNNNTSGDNSTIHHEQMPLAQEQRSPNFPGVHVQQQQQQQYSHHPREQLRYKTNIAPNTTRTQQPNRTSPPPTGPELTVVTSRPLDLTKRASIPLSSSTTLSTPSPIPTTTSSAITAAMTMTNDSSSVHTTSSISTSTRSKNKPHQRKRPSYYYIAFRILFSCGLAVLALYWPASKRKPPLGYLPNLRESQNQHGDRSVTPDSNNNSRGDDTQHSPTITPTIVARAFLPYALIKEFSPTPPASTFTSFRSRKSKRQRSSYGDDDGAPVKDNNGSDKLESAASGHYGLSGATGAGPDSRVPPNVRPGGPGSGGYGSHWCSLEEAFGDNQSAVVYCQVKDVRPVMTYIWASLILLELCVAYCAGDFAIAGTRGQKGSSHLVEVKDDDHDPEDRSVAAVATTASENRSWMEVQEQQPPWMIVEQDQVLAQGHVHQLGHSGISITVTEAGAEGAGVGNSRSMDLARKNWSTDRPIGLY